MPSDEDRWAYYTKKVSFVEMPMVTSRPILDTTVKIRSSNKSIRHPTIKDDQLGRGQGLKSLPLPILGLGELAVWQERGTRLG